MCPKTVWLKLVLKLSYEYHGGNHISFVSYDGMKSFCVKAMKWKYRLTNYLNHLFVRNWAHKNSWILHLCFVDDLCLLLSVFLLFKLLCLSINVNYFLNGDIKVIRICNNLWRMNQQKEKNLERMQEESGIKKKIPSWMPS